MKYEGWIFQFLGSNFLSMASYIMENQLKEYDYKSWEKKTFFNDLKYFSSQNSIKWYSYLMMTDIIKHCLMSKHVHVVPSDQTASNVYDHAQTMQTKKMFYNVYSTVTFKC